MEEASRRTPFVFGLFFISGALALVYEVAWVRLITLEFGSTTLAVSTVVSTFMGGLALGAWLAGRRADRFSDPLSKYGYLETGLALYAALSPLLFAGFLPVFGNAGSAISDHILFLSIIRFIVAGLLLLPPTIAMGATLPLLCRHYADESGRGSRGAGLLYGINTIGAFIGTVLAGFVLLPAFGVLLTILLAAAINLAVGIIAILLGRGRTVKRPEETKAGPRSVAVLIAVALTGFAALACEVAWARLMALVLGGSIYAFSVVLGTFLAGLGLGAAGVATLLRGSPERAREHFFGLALTSAVTVCLSYVLCRHLPAFFLNLFWTWDLTADPDRVLHAQLLLSAAVIFVPSLFMGGLFPAAARITVDDSTRTGESVSGIYAWNTIGSILGSFAAGFILIPWLGIRGTLLVAVAGQSAGGLAAVYRRGDPKRSGLLAGAGAAVLLIALGVMPGWSPQLMTSGMYSYADGYDPQSTDDLARILGEQEELLYYRDGLTATVTVSRDKRYVTRDLYISTNGKLDGSSHYDMPTQRLSAHLPLLLHPTPKRACVIGLGTGCTAGSASLHSIEELTVVEIEAAMVEGARFFKDHNHDVLNNPEVDLRVTDGRLFLRVRPDHFDVLISEPSNPWLAGTSDLFTVEFFELGRRSLREGGIFCQWVQLYGLRPENLRILIRTFARVFPNVYVVSTIRNTDLLLLGTDGQLDFDPGRLSGRLTGAVASDLADERIEIMNAYDLLARVRMGPQEIGALTGPGPLHTDDRPVIAYRAPRDLYRSTRLENMALLAEHARGVAPYLSGASPDIYRRLFEAYDRFLPGGNEARVAAELGR